MGKCGIVFKGTLVRALFSLHAGLSVWLISKENELYLLIWLLFLLLIFVEGVFTMKVKKHGTWKWFSPTVCLFLLCSVPCLWKLELESFETLQEIYTDPNTTTCDKCTRPMKTLSLPTLFGLKVPVVSELSLSLQDWTLVLHQTLLFMLILGRWLLPKGELTRDQLSQLLLVQIGMAADILEFVTEGLKAEMMAYPTFTNLQVFVILIVWTWSLPQFTLSLTLTKSRKPRVAGTGSILKKQPHEDKRGNNFGVCHLFCGTEVWAILVTMTMQDLPFLGTRLYLIFDPDIPLSIPFFFFTFKNALLTMLQLYRLSIILQEYRHQRMTRVRVTPEHNPPSIIELEDVAPVDEPRESPPSPPDPQQPPTTPWFASRFLSGFVGPKLRQRKHVSIQTEQSLQIVASISSHWAVDVHDEEDYFYQYADTNAKQRDTRSPDPNDASSPTPGGSVPRYRRKHSRTLSETPRSPLPKSDVGIESPTEGEKDELTVIFNKSKYDREDQGSIKEKLNSAWVTSTETRNETSREVNAKAEGRDRVEDVAVSAGGELVNDAINDIISNFEDWSDADTQLPSPDDKPQSRNRGEKKCETVTRGGEDDVAGGI